MMPAVSHPAVPPPTMTTDCTAATTVRAPLVPRARLPRTRKGAARRRPLNVTARVALGLELRAHAHRERPAIFHQIQGLVAEASVAVGNVVRQVERLDIS